jgi:hypothetical protein
MGAIFFIFAVCLAPKEGIAAILYAIPYNRATGAPMVHTKHTAKTPVEDVEEEEEEESAEEESERRAKSAAAYKSNSLDERTVIYLRDAKRFFHGRGGEICSLVRRGKRLARQHHADTEHVIAHELRDLATVIALGDGAPLRCWGTVDTLIGLPH